MHLFEYIRQSYRQEPSRRHPSPRRRLHALDLLRRVLASCAAIYILVCEVTGSIANKQVLRGVSTAPTSTIVYGTSLILDFIATAVDSPTSVAASFAALAPRNGSNMPVAYLDVATTTNQPTLLSGGCAVPNPDIDYIYSSRYVNLVVQNALAGFNTSDVVAVVDCSDDGRTFSDTSVLKLHLVDTRVTRVTTVLLVVLSVTRPKLQLTSSGGIAMFTTTPLASLSYNPTTSTLAVSQPATYSLAMGFTFPYEVAPFDPIQVDALEPPTGQWQATVTSTGERFSFSGTTGIYRNAPAIQGSFHYFYWDLPASPLAFASATRFFDIHVFKDSWGWFRCFLGLGIGFNICLNTCVALAVMVNMYVNDGVVWVPDVYPSIQRRAIVRATLLLADCLVNQWWYPFQWALIQASYRGGWGGTIDFNEISRGDNLMITLACACTAALALRVRVDLSVVVALYVVVYAYRILVVNQVGVALRAANKFAKADYLANIFPTPGGGAMDLWAYHENFGTNFVVVANEYTWLFVSAGAGVAYVVLVKVAHVVAWGRSSTTRSTPRPGIWPTFSRAIMGESTSSQSPPSRTRSLRQSSAGRSASVHWSYRSSLYDGVTDDDVENTRFERSVGLVSVQRYGFVAPTLDTLHDGPTEYVSPSGVWLLGFVIVDNSVVVAINDYVFVLINAICRKSVFTIYGFLLEKDDVVATHKQRIAPETIHLGKVWRVALKPLR
ncbi:Aste57867_17026 [Aphanomyces stellatus]|uniref:Aste57867_17026 protein n=1 Tax=Aphanomyces stellatus TaxID=120398 RepID=A0A485L753_9STRA|nr:hypothetical protein As57867_016968 [Aphanomyces stellatus]VFT93787.1 Aste57867_17026 [Aphanomyces stellatus]